MDITHSEIPLPGGLIFREHGDSFQAWGVRGARPERPSKIPHLVAQLEPFRMTPEKWWEKVTDCGRRASYGSADR